MINGGLARKAAYELWLPTLGLGALAAGFEGILAYVLPSYAEQFSETIRQLAFVRSLVGAMLGIGAADQLSATSFVALGWAHPVILSVVLAHAAIVCTRVPAGEIDRGTIDILLAWPVSRWEVFRTETACWLASGAGLVALTLAGNFIGRGLVEPALRVPPGWLAIVAVNLLGLYLVAGGLAWLVSACSDRRGLALAIVLSGLLSAFLLNYLAELWPPARQVVMLSPMHYYRPLEVLQNGRWPTGDLVVLTVAAASLWAAAGVIFCRRDICTV